MQGVFLEAAREAGPSCRRNACLASVEAFAEQLVCVRPMEIACLVLNVLSLALVMGPANYLSKDGVLHRDARETSDVCSRRLVIFVTQAVGIGVVRRLET